MRVLEYKREDGSNDLDDVRIHPGISYRVLGSLLILERAKVLVELTTRHGRRSASPSLIWHHHRKFHDMTMVLLPLLRCRQRGVRFYLCASILLKTCVRSS